MVTGSVVVTGWAVATEATDIDFYLRELKPDGVMAFHVTNRYLDLQPVLKALADHFALRSVWVHHEAGELARPSDWILLARNDRVLGQRELSSRRYPLDTTRAVRLWTDDYSNLFQILK
ncbi:MAG: hypothetical protein JWM69_312 [Candidatus Binatus sp.]|nr:hypothetical protein [Candidatus Binatus sp.]